MRFTGPALCAMLLLCGAMNALAQLGFAVIVTGQPAIGQVLVDANNVYWVDSSGGRIRAVPKAGGTVTLFGTRTRSGGDVVQDADALYFAGADYADGYDIYRQPKAGGAAVEIASNVVGFASNVVMRPGGGTLYYGGSRRDIPGTGKAATGTQPAIPPSQASVLASRPASGGPETVLVWDTASLSAASLAALQGKATCSGCTALSHGTSDGTFLYWSTFGAIWRMPLAGGSPTALFSGRGTIYSMIAPAEGAGAGSIFWKESSAVMRRRADGAIITVLSDSLSDYFAVAGDKVLGESGALVQVSIDGGLPTHLKADSTGPTGIALDSTDIYWGNLAGSISRVSRPDGGTPPPPPPPPPPPGCSYDVEVNTKLFPASGDNAVIKVTASADSCVWSASSDSNWLTADGTSITGSRWLLFNVAENPGQTTRTGKLTVVGQEFYISQAAAGAPPDGPFVYVYRPMHLFHAGSDGKSFIRQTKDRTVGLFQRGEPGTVAWTATSNQPWLVVSPASGSGAGVLTGLLTIGVRFHDSVKDDGVYEGRISIALTGASNAILPLKVLLNVYKGAIELVDPACDTATVCLGNRISSDGSVTSNPVALAAAPVLRRGAITDGVSQLLVRIRTDVAVTLSLNLGDGAAPSTWGTLRALTGSVSGNSIRVLPEQVAGKSFAFAIYQPPIDFPDTTISPTLRQTSRLSIRAKPDGSEGELRAGITLSRVPVLLMHSMWSKATEWAALESHLKAGGFEDVWRVNYEGLDVGSFDPLRTGPGSASAIPILTWYAERARRELQNRGFAATQVDVVAHGLGGLLARGRVAQDTYRRRDNYRRGEFHKIVTVGTPHHGTPLANWLMEHRCDTGGGRTVEQWFAHADKPLGLAQVQMQTNSQSLQRLGATDVPSHAIVGIEPEGSWLERLHNAVFRVTGHGATTMDSLLGGNGNHDVLTHLSSQRGGFAADARTQTTIGGIVYSSSMQDVSETSALLVHRQIADLLRTATVSESFASFPPPTLTGGMAWADSPCSSPQIGASAEATAQLTLSPASGSVVRPGETIPITLSLAGANPVEGAVLTAGGEAQIVDGTGPFTFSVRIPDRAGRLDLAAFTFGTSAAAYAASGHLTVVPADAPRRLDVTPEQAALSAIGETLQLQVNAAQSSGQVIDLTAGSSGTVYSVSAGSDVVAVSADGLIEAKRTGDAAVLITNGAAKAVVAVSVGTSGATMAAEKTSLAFAAVSNGGAFTSRTAPQFLRVIQVGVAPVAWSVTSSAAWLAVSPSSGTGSSTLTISVAFDPAVGQPGVANAGLTLALADGEVAELIDVTLAVAASTVARSPAFGVVDTPSESMIHSGSVALTGWTLDNIGVKRVELWRSVQAGETTPPFTSTPDDPRSGKIFIGNAVFTDGARPDVETLNAALPFASRAGWGYLLLTQGLWDQGNGVYFITAYAFDEEDNLSKIGTKALSISNRSATKPFGGIDTPGIGGDPGTTPNFGWALTPKVNGAATCRIPANGVQVSIDSGPLQPAVYGDARTDIAGAFPGYSNSDGAGGHFIFDWSTLSNGPHTIGWLVTDDCNRADGVGSRFFNVTTSSSLLAAPANEPTAALRAAETLADEPVTVAYGYGELPRIVEPGPDGAHIVELRQGDRIELRVPRDYSGAHQIVGGQIRNLPLGSTWDAASGTFYWQPAPAFLGTFRLVFANGRERINVRVLVAPRGP